MNQLMVNAPANAMTIASSTALTLSLKTAARLVILSIIFVLLGVSANAQVSPYPFVRPQFLDNTGKPLAGGKLWTYQSGTSVQQATYCDALGTVLNQNPIIMDAGGRPAGTAGSSSCGIFLGANAYKFVLQNSLGSQIWSIDNIAASSTSLLASANTWTGTNQWQNNSTFNGPVSMNVGFTSTGPNFLSGGGSLTGTWSGGPIFSGLPNFSGGFLATTGTFSGQITSTLATGTAPFVVTSTTVVPNLNASLLGGCYWAAPCPIGSLTPTTGVFTALTANTSFTLNGGTTQIGTQGTGTKLLTAGTVTGNSKFLCTDNVGGGSATTANCPSIPVNVQNFTFCPSGCNITGTPCSTSGASYAKCSTTINLPAPYTDTNYAVVCQGITSTQFPYIDSVAKTSSSSITVVIANGTSNGAMVSTYQELDCQSSHN
jgi:hypothetical protein